MPDILNLSDITAGYDGATVLDNVSLSLAEHGTLGVIGRNGVGKSTLLATIMGATELVSGRILFDGKDITGLATHLRNRAGIGYVPQEREIFASLTVDENLRVAARSGRWTLEGIYDVLPRLAERRGNLGSRLSGGEQQMLAVGRALIGNPKVILLDEPFEGLAPIIVDALVDALARIVSDKSLALIIVEHKVDLVLDMVQRVIGLDRGRIAWQGPSEDLRGQTHLIDGLLGLGGLEESDPSGAVDRDRRDEA